MCYTSNPGINAYYQKGVFKKLFQVAEIFYVLMMDGYIDKVLYSSIISQPPACENSGGGEPLII